MYTLYEVTLWWCHSESPIAQGAKRGSRNEMLRHSRSGGNPGGGSGLGILFLSSDSEESL